MYKNEKVYRGEKPVKYVFDKTYQETDGLIIIFSGFHPPDTPPCYNYGRTIEEFHCNKLFILDDFGARASYYLCENRDFSIERSIYALIEDIIKENNIKTVMTAGSSKGGYAALYYGIKYGFDHIIAASPQYFIGDYLLKQTPTNDVAIFMAGDDTNDSHQFLNHIMENVISTTKYKPNIFIHLGEGEKHYSQHVSPMIKDFERVGMSYTLDLGNYDKHNDVSKFFPPIFKSKIREYLGYPKLEISVKKVDNGKTYQFKALTGAQNEIAWYLYHNNNKIDVKKYNSNKEYDFLPDARGKYKMKVFVRNKRGLIVSANSLVINV